jgi:endonuclease-3
MRGKRDMTEKKEKLRKILSILRETHSDAPATYLDYKNAFEMLIATILSAHTADASVNKVTPELFKRYPTPEKLAKAELQDLMEIVRSTGSYNQKSAYIKETAQTLVEHFNGEVPQKIDDLVLCKGVSRKTANVVLSVAFGINEGVVVDTHIRRVTQRLALTKEDRPEKIEADLMEMLPKDEWGDYARLVGAHGRRVCAARKPDCHGCTLNHLCPSANQWSRYH